MGPRVSRTRARAAWAEWKLLELPVGLRLLLGQVLGSLEQRPAGVLEAPGGLLVAEPAELVPVVAANFVERLIGQLHDVERVDANRGLRRVFADCLGVPGAHVHRYRLELAGPVTDPPARVLSCPPGLGTAGSSGPTAAA